MLRRWKLPGHHSAPVDDDLRRAPYYTEHRASPVFNLLFAAMYDLILCRIPKMGLLVPGQGRTVADVLEERIPKYDTNDDDDEVDADSEPEYVVGPKLQWLIYSAPFKAPDHGKRAGVHSEHT